jgi:hypothetical protein
MSLIRDLLDKSLLSQVAKRQDGQLWVSDLGYHPAKAMNRILNGKRDEFPLGTLDVMEDGNMYEANTAHRIMRFYPGSIHTNMPLWNDVWSGYADMVLNHGTDSPVIVEHKATDGAYWAKARDDDPGKSYAPVKSTHVCQLWLYGELYRETYGVQPKLILFYRAWKHYCEVEVKPSEAGVLVQGEMDRKPFERFLLIYPHDLRIELEQYYRHKMMPTYIYAHGEIIDPATWNYADLR